VIWNSLWITIFREVFKIKEKSKKFNSHEELDTFIHYLQKSDMEFELKYKNEWVLLKSFDRAFWMRYYKFPNDAKWCPCKKKKMLMMKEMLNILSIVLLVIQKNLIVLDF